MTTAKTATKSTAPTESTGTTTDASTTKTNTTTTPTSDFTKGRADKWASSPHDPYAHDPAIVEKRELVDPPTFRPIPEFEGVHNIWPRGDRLEAVRKAAVKYRNRFLEQGTVLGVKSFDIAAAPYPAQYAFQNYTPHINPLINIINRMLVIQYEDFNGVPRTLVWEPTVADGSKKAGFYSNMIGQGNGPKWLNKAMSTMYKMGSEKIMAKLFNDPDDILPSVGLSNNDVDYVSFDHLHVQDPRMIMGSTAAPAPGEKPFEPLFPHARLLVHEAELGTFESQHPMQASWYVDGGLDGVDREVLSTFQGDVEIGVGISLLWTPGHTDGNHSLCINTPDGVWISSENGMAADSWHPELSKIPGLRTQAAFYEREVVLNANTLEDSIDQYDSMIKEKTMASYSKDHPHWKQILPSSECASWKRQWPLNPTVAYGGIDYGELKRR